MIASPGDVAAEREIVTQEMYRWNNANAVTRALVLQPVKWETHSSPQMGAPAQDILNERLLIDADIVVGIFGTRIGTATNNFISGSVEEIKRHVAAGKLAMLYFSHVPVDPNSIDQKQWLALQAFKEECKKGGLYAEYSSHEQLGRDFGHHLTIELNRPKYLWLTKPDVAVEPQDPDLDEYEKRLLIATASDRNGQILTGSTTDGYYVQSNDQNFVDDSPRSAAVWKRVISRLYTLGYISRVNDEVFELTEDGFARADKEIASEPLEMSVSFAGPPDNQKLSVKANKHLRLTQIEFLMSSEARVSNSELNEEIRETAEVPIDYKKVSELFNAPRPDRNPYDFSGPAALRFSVSSGGQRFQLVLPVFLQPKSVGNTQWIEIMGSKTFLLK